jgi:hypothetical protein
MHGNAVVAATPKGGGTLAATHDSAYYGCCDFEGGSYVAATYGMMRWRIDGMLRL